MDMNEWLRKQLEEADPDLLREMVRSFAETLMGADADEVCGAPYGTVSPDRVNRRNGYRTRRWDTRVGRIDLRIPKLREGTYFPDWLLDVRTRSERAFIQCVAEAYVRGVSTRRVEGLVETLGISSLSKSQVSELAKELDEMVTDFRNRPLDAGPYTYVWADALTMKVREGAVGSVASDGSSADPLVRRLPLGARRCGPAPDRFSGGSITVRLLGDES